ncbi:hypothetical protein B0H16DRAFT_1701498 [Mycena metata]|uniref:Uncharacterized protein n=1 Tax=Mycena metata TaxID=1033252 RepID=A0AAD7HAJ8_9AGAR|nr:hypothetical protein B0H16DRAFT_1701498 [Mycena metata]
MPQTARDRKYLRRNLKAYKPLPQKVVLGGRMVLFPYLPSFHITRIEMITDGGETLVDPPDAGPAPAHYVLQSSPPGPLGGAQGKHFCANLGSRSSDRKKMDDLEPDTLITVER